MSTVSFPALGIEFTINRVMFSIGGFQVYWYGVLIAFGMLLGIWFAVKNARRFGVNEDRMMDVILISALVAVTTGRAFYLLFADNYSVSGIADFFNLRDGGTAFYGVLLGAIVSAFFTTRLRKVRFLPMADMLGIGFLIGQGIGRWGNFFNQELFGTNTDLPWGMYSDTIARYISRNAARLEEMHGIILYDAPVHPTFLYESIWCLLGAFILYRQIEKRRFDGELFLKFLVWNGVGRAFTESLRTDALFLGRIRISRLVCICLAVIGVLFLIAIRARIRREGDDEFLKPYGKTEAFALEQAEWEAKAAEKAAKKAGKQGEEEAAERALPQQEPETPAQDTPTDAAEALDEAAVQSAAASEQEGSEQEPQTH